MKNIKFDGKVFASKKEKALAKKVAALKKKGVTPKLATVLLGDIEINNLYVNLKKKAAERVGAEVEIYNVSITKHKSYIFNLLRVLNNDSTVHGIMIQLPPADKWKRHMKSFINFIDPKKDVDGLKEDSPYIKAVTRATAEILEVAFTKLGLTKKAKILIIGNKGSVGKANLAYLKIQKYDVEGWDRRMTMKPMEIYRSLLKISNNYDALVSSIGIPGLITEEAVKEGSVVIDISAPKGDADFHSAAKKAAFITPVPGGVGPVTISCLLENLVEAAYNQSR